VKRVSPIDSAVVAKIESAFEQKVKDLDPTIPSTGSALVPGST
jgi:hypothetical protein